jgi:hypothetical protein
MVATSAGTMEYVGFGLLFVLVLGAIWACDAGRLGKAELYRISENGRIISEDGKILCFIYFLEPTDFINILTLLGSNLFYLVMRM